MIAAEKIASGRGVGRGAADLACGVLVSYSGTPPRLIPLPDYRGESSKWEPVHPAAFDGLDVAAAVSAVIELRDKINPRAVAYIGPRLLHLGYQWPFTPAMHARCGYPPPSPSWVSVRGLCVDSRTAVAVALTSCDTLADVRKLAAHELFHSVFWMLTDEEAAAVESAGDMLRREVVKAKLGSDPEWWREPEEAAAEAFACWLSGHDPYPSRPLPWAARRVFQRIARGEVGRR